jgi:hypothetical protein
VILRHYGAKPMLFVNVTGWRPCPVRGESDWGFAVRCPSHVRTKADARAHAINHLAEMDREYPGRRYRIGDAWVFRPRPKQLKAA